MCHIFCVLVGLAVFEANLKDFFIETFITQKSHGITTSHPPQEKMLSRKNAATPQDFAALLHAETTESRPANGTASIPGEFSSKLDKVVSKCNTLKKETKLDPSPNQIEAVLENLEKLDVLLNAILSPSPSRAFSVSKRGPSPNLGDAVNTAQSSPAAKKMKKALQNATDLVPDLSGFHNYGFSTPTKANQCPAPPVKANKIKSASSYLGTFSLL